jgi:hypothetical protein
MRQGAATRRAPFPELGRRDTATVTDDKDHQACQHCCDIKPLIAIAGIDIISIIVT